MIAQLDLHFYWKMGISFILPRERERKEDAHSIARRQYDDDAVRLLLIGVRASRLQW